MTTLIETVRAKQIGRCPSCEHPQCPMPKHAKQYPNQGCADWQTQEALSDPEPPTCTVEKVKD